jgi:hypothetical protein
VQHLRGAALGMPLSFRSNIRLGWKSWTGKNSLAYKNVYITVVKSFIKCSLLYVFLTLFGFDAHDEVK